ncbi:SHOCT domain-containing protein [Sulfuriferula nivalis]|uniref:SHOCT domain-containing protein n=1 Tax=Sulfuriferula nivalis TaxID=2675298 RepID=A0A809RGV3_9PROT|nr:SHOCT domain-containing protein [Sulfuriferula nivalis]BBP00795.1 hypothetical protein SFSGTM_15030 [Sulfuriferula nivalis]
MLKIGIRGLLASLFFMSSIAAAESSSTISRFYLVNPDPTDVKGSVDALVAAIGTRTYFPSKHINLMPTELPDRPSEPSSQTINLGPVTMSYIGCGNSAYAQVGVSSSSSNGILGQSKENIFGCVYLSKKGTRIAIINEQKSSSSSGLMSGIMSGIKDAVQGNDAEYSKKMFNEMLAKAKEKIPGILVELEELPEEGVTRPDDDKLKQLGFNVPLPPVQPAEMVENKLATTPVVATNANTSTPAAAQTQQQKIELLKSLVELKKSGALTDQEFTDEKRKILNN